MKVVHINKKNFEREKAIKEAGRELMDRRAILVYKQMLRLQAKYEANKKP